MNQENSGVCECAKECKCNCNKCSKCLSKRRFPATISFENECCSKTSVSSEKEGNDSSKKESARMGESLGMKNAAPEMGILDKTNKNQGSNRPLGNGSIPSEKPIDVDKNNYLDVIRKTIYSKEPFKKLEEVIRTDERALISTGYLYRVVKETFFESRKQVLADVKSRIEKLFEAWRIADIQLNDGKRKNIKCYHDCQLMKDKIIADLESEKE